MEYRQALDHLRRLLRENPRGLTTTAVAQKLTVNRNTAAKYLDVLHALGEVELRRYGPAKVWFFTPGIPLHALVDFSSSNVLILDEHLTVTQMNKRLAHDYASTRDSLVGKPYRQLESLDQEVETAHGTRSLYKCIMLALSGSSVEVPCFHRKDSDSSRYFHLSLYPTMISESQSGVVIIYDDVTNRILAEEQLRATTSFLQNLVDSSIDAIFTLDMDGVIQSFNRGAEEMTGFDAEQALGDLLEQYCPHTDAVQKMLQQVREDGAVRNFETLLSTRSGTPLAVTFSLSLLRDETDETDEPIGIVGIGRNISDQKRAEHAMRRSERRYRRLFENARDGIVIVTPDGAVKEMNRAGLTVLGYDTPCWPCSIYEHLRPASAQRLRDAFAVLEDGRTIPLIELTFVHDDGMAVPVEMNLTHIYDEDGKFVVVQGIFRDITERKRTARELERHREQLQELVEERSKALRASESKYRTLIDNLSDTIVELDSTGEFLFISPQVEGLFGRTPAELVGKNVFDYIHPADLEEAKTLFGRAIEVGETVSLDLRSQHKNEDYIEISGSGRTVTKDGNDITIVSVIRDVTAAKSAQRELKAAEARFRALVQHLADAITILDTNGTITYASPSIVRVLGYSPEEVLGRNPAEFVHDQDYPPMVAAFDTLIDRPGTPIERTFRMRHKDGSWCYIEGTGINLTADAAVGGVIATFRNCTKRTLAEDALQRSEMRLRTVIQSARDPIFIKNRDLVYRLVNPAMERLFALPASTLIGMTDRELFGPKIAPTIEEHDRRVLAGETVEEEVTKPVCGEPRTFNAIKVPMRDDHGGIIGICGIARDVTQRQREAEELTQYRAGLEALVEQRTQELRETNARLRESEERFHALYERSFSGIYVYDFEGRFLDANDAALEIVGYNRDAFLELTIWNLLDPTDHDRAAAAVERIHQTGSQSTMSEYRLIRSDDARIWVETESAMIYRDGEPYAIQGVCRDISYRKQYENGRNDEPVEPVEPDDQSDAEGRFAS